MTRKDFKNRAEGFLISAMGWYNLAEAAVASGYPDHIQHWRDEFERILFIDLTFFIRSVTTKTAFDRRRAINEVIADYNSAKTFQVSLLMAGKNLAARYLKRQYAELKMPEVEPSRNTFWLMVSGAVKLALEES